MGGVQSLGRESFIPAGANCRTSSRFGPGVPWFETASPALRSSIDGIDHGDPPANLHSAVATAGKEDAVSLWHLLRRVPPDQRGLVYDRLAALVAIPPQVTRVGIIRGDPRAIDALWGSLGYGDTTWWRMWKHWQEPGQATR